MIISFLEKFENKKTFKISKKYFHKYKNFIIYVGIGLMGLLVDLGIFFVLYNILQVDPIIANIVSSITAMSHNFILNSLFNFKKKDRLYIRLISFLIVGGLGLILSSFILSILIGPFGLNVNLAKLVALFIVVCLQYNFNKRLTFK